MDDRVAAFIGKNHAAAMATLRPDGTAHVVRVGVGVADGKIWSSGTQFRLRTKHLRRDPRSTLFVFDTSPDPRFLSLETTVTILEGPDAPELHLRLFREMQGERAADGKIAWFGGELTEEEFLETMRAEGRLIYEFDVKRAYGYY